MTLVDKHLHDIDFWQTLDARHAGMSRAVNAVPQSPYPSSPGHPSPMEGSFAGASSPGNNNKWGPFLYVPGQRTSVENRAGSPVWHPKGGEGDESGLSLPHDHGKPKRKGRSNLEARLAELEAALEHIPVGDQDKEVDALMNDWARGDSRSGGGGGPREEEETRGGVSPPPRKVTKLKPHARPASTRTAGSRGQRSPSSRASSRQTASRAGQGPSLPSCLLLPYMGV